MFMGIDHVQLAAPKGSEEEARHFFSDILGMVEIPKPANLARRGGVWFQVGIHQLHIGIQPDFMPAKKAHPAFCVKDAISLRKKLIENGISVKDDEPLEGAVRFYVYKLRQSVSIIFPVDIKSARDSNPTLDDSVIFIRVT